MGKTSFEVIAEAYRAMAGFARYRPQTPGDGLGNISLSEEELEDPRRLVSEAGAYAARFIEEEDSRKFFIGVGAYTTKRAFVWTIEAARVLAAGDNARALKLLAAASQNISSAPKPAPGAPGL
jgi:hypothetical protein